MNSKIDCSHFRKNKLVDGKWLKSKFYHWICEERTNYYNIGMRDDGSVFNPRGYPVDKVCQLLAEIEAERLARAQATRERRRQKLIYEIGKGVLANRKYGPCAFCCVCKKSLTDDASIERGIGPACWDHILIFIEHEKDRAAANDVTAVGLDA